MRRVRDDQHAVGLAATRDVPRACLRSPDEHDEPAGSLVTVDRLGECALGRIGDRCRAEHGGLGADREPSQHRVDERVEVDTRARREDGNGADPRLGAAGPAVVHPVRDEPGKRQRDAWGALDRALEHILREARELGVADGDDGRRSRRSRQQAELSDGVAARQLPDHDHLAGIVGQESTQPAPDDHVEAVGRFALVEEGFAARHLDPLELVEQRVELGVGEPRDDVHRRHRLAGASGAFDAVHRSWSEAVR